MGETGTYKNMSFGTTGGEPKGRHPSCEISDPRARGIVSAKQQSVRLLLFDIQFIGSFIHSINQHVFIEQLARPWKYHIDLQGP